MSRGDQLEPLEPEDVFQQLRREHAEIGAETGPTFTFAAFELQLEQLERCRQQLAEVTTVGRIITTLATARSSVLALCRLFGLEEKPRRDDDAGTPGRGD